MRYMSNTKNDIKQMLSTIGKKSVDQLFDIIPDNLKTKESINISALTEWDLNIKMEQLASKNLVSKSGKQFIGAGSYDHYIPATIPHLASRGEFITAYTPYQPEVSQGTLQAIYEFQTMVGNLLGMDIVTASHYDCSSALAEACLIALRANKKANKIAISNLVHPNHHQVINTYLGPSDFEIVEIPYTKEGLTDISALRQMNDIAGIVIQSPNFFGNIEDLAVFRQIADDKKIFFINSFTEAMAFGLIKNPGYFKPDLVVGDGQSFGISRMYGGPSLGIMSGNNKQMRNLPGRLIGKTVDQDGKEGYVMTIVAREQHIRREKASSNICSNNGINAVCASIYLASAGKKGLREIAQQNHDKAHYLKESLKSVGFKDSYSRNFFNEFIMKAPNDFSEKRAKLIEKHGIVAGLDLSKFYPELNDHYLFCATETNKKIDIDLLVEEIK